MLLTEREMQTGILVTAQHSTRKDWLLNSARIQGRKAGISRSSLPVKIIGLHSLCSIDE